LRDRPRNASRHTSMKACGPRNRRRGGVTGAGVERTESTGAECDIDLHIS
jgi:hypothetical protein